MSIRVMRRAAEANKAGVTEAMSVYCGWCGKQRRRLSGFQKRGVQGNLIEICSYCKREHENVQIKNPFGGLLQELTEKRANDEV